MSEPKGMLLVISGPSGVGKGTLVRLLRQKVPDLMLSVSVTTRKPRENEQDGRDYFFITQEEFDRMVQEGRLLEHASVHGKSYGTPRDYVRQMIDQGKTVILEIDPQGARQVIEKQQDCVSVFILPPSWKQLRDRLTGRQTEAPEQVETRLKNAREEVKTLCMYRYAVTNMDGEEGKQAAVEALCTILRAERFNTARLTEGIPEE